MFFLPSLVKGKQLTLVEMETYFKKNELLKIEGEELKKRFLKLGSPAMTLLTKVIRENFYPVHSRWSVFFFIGQLMGKKSQNDLVKLTENPLWLLRLVTLKTLLHIKADNLVPIYAKKLKEESCQVKVQNLENGKHKRSEIIKQALKTLADFKYLPMTKGLVKMIKKNPIKIFKLLVYNLQAQILRREKTLGVI